MLHSSGRTGPARARQLASALTAITVTREIAD